MGDECMYEYCDYDDYGMGPWATFFTITLAAILFILLWPIILVIFIYMAIQESRWESKMKKLDDEARRKRMMDDLFSEEKKKSKRRSKNGKKNIKSKSKKN